MYEIVHTNAVIFLERREKEYDKVFFIFSRALGLTSVVAPGIYKTGAKLISLVQPLRIVTCDIVVGKSIKKITTVIEATPFEHLLAHQTTKKSILSVFEFITTMVPRNVAVPEIYDLFEQFIKELDINLPEETIKRLEINTLYHILLVLGYIDHEEVSILPLDDIFYTAYTSEIYNTLLHRVNRSLKEIHT